MSASHVCPLEQLRFQSTACVRSSILGYATTTVGFFSQVFTHPASLPCHDISQASELWQTRIRTSGVSRIVWQATSQHFLASLGSGLHVNVTPTHPSQTTSALGRLVFVLVHAARCLLLCSAYHYFFFRQLRTPAQKRSIWSRYWHTPKAPSLCVASSNSNVLPSAA